MLAPASVNRVDTQILSLTPKGHGTHGCDVKIASNHNILSFSFLFVSQM